MEPRLEPKFPEPWPPVFHHPKPAHTHLRFVNSTGCVSVFLHTVPERLLDMSDKRKRDREMQTQRDKERNTQRDKERQQESSRKASISAFLTMPKPLTVWITIAAAKTILLVDEAVSHKSIC